MVKYQFGVLFRELIGKRGQAPFVRSTRRAVPAKGLSPSFNWPGCVMGAAGHIELRGVRVHNLKSVDLDLPRGKLIVFCGTSGSGKSSLALDTLYAEGQRRYIESFSAYTRQFLARLEKPEAERIDGIPPAIAVAGSNIGRSSRSTVGTATETDDYLRLLMAKIGQVFCSGCGREVRCDTPAKRRRDAGRPAARQAIPDRLRLPAGRGRLDRPLAAAPPRGRLCAGHRRRADGRWRPGERGAGTRVVSGQWSVASRPVPAFTSSSIGSRVGNRARSAAARLAGNGLRQGHGRATRLWKAVGGRRAAPSARRTRWDSLRRPAPTASGVVAQSRTRSRRWRPHWFQHALACEDCGIDYPMPEPRLYSFNSPLGACPECEGFGNVIGMDMDLVVPDPAKSIRDGAIAPWNTPAYAHELEELLALAGDYGIAGGRAVPGPCAEPAGVDRARRAGAEVRRPGRFFRLAGAAEVQDAHPRVSEPLAELSVLPGLRRHAAAARGPGRPDRRPATSARSAP